MSGGGRPPNSAPSLPLHSSPSTPVDSLQTPDTSSLFLSSLGSHAGPRAAEFTSLEDLLNFSGIAQQTTSSLEVLAHDLEQKQAGPPEAKRLCTDLTSTSSLSTTLNSSSSGAPSTVLVSPLPQSKATAPVTRNSLTSPVAIPTLFPTSGQSAVALASTQPTPTREANITPQTTTRPTLTKPSSSSGTVRLLAGSSVSLSTPLPSSVSSSIPVSLLPSLTPSPSTSVSTPANTPLTLPSSVTSSIATLNPITSSSPVVPSVLAQSPTHTSSISPVTIPLSTSSAVPSKSLQIFHSTSVGLSSSTTASSMSVASNSSSVSTAGQPPLPSLPANPAQRALLVQLVQAYKQCSALGDMQGQAKVKAQLNLLLQAQQKMAAVSSSNHTTFLQTTVRTTVPSQVTVSSSLTPITSTTSLPQSSFLNSPNTSLLNTSNNTSLLSIPNTSLHSSSTSLPQSSLHTPSLPTSSGIGVVTNSQLPHKFGLKSSFTSPTTQTLTSLTPISSQSRVTAPSGPASALKAAALYNLRLRQLQLFLQSLPEDQRPHSIPELKALLQRSGGPLGALAQTAAGVTSTAPTSTSAAPVPTLLSSSLPRSVTGHTMPTVGQCMPQLSQGPPPANSLPVTTVPPSTAGLLRSLAWGSMPLSPTSLSRFTGSLPCSSPVSTLPTTSQQSPTTTGTTANLPLTTRTAGTTATLPLTTGTTATLPLTAGTTATLPVTTGTTATLPVTTGTTVTLPVTTGTTVTLPVTTGTTVTLPVTTGTTATTQGATVTLPLTTAASQAANILSVSDVNKSLTTATSTSISEPIKPGVPTPLPPGVNPETLGVLCRLPDTDLQKLKLPAVLMTAIRVWRGQQNSSIHRGRKPVGSQAVPIIIPPTTTSSVTSSSISQSTGTPQATSLAPSAGRLQPASRPVTRHQVRAEQNKAEKDRLAALNKVLQSSEEARIAYRFSMLRDKMTNQLMAPDNHTPFKSLHDVIARLLPYHMWSEAEPPPGAIEKADAVYESVAQVLMSRSQGLMSNYQHLIYHDAKRDSEAVMAVCLERLFQESERERREQESQQSQQAAQVAADLSLIAGALGSGGGPLSGLDFDAEFAFGDVMNSDPMLTFEPGIT